MVTILLDTMEILKLLSEPEYQRLADAIDREKIQCTISVISLTEIYKVVGVKDERAARELIMKIIGSKLNVVDVDTRIARKAGELRLKHNMPTADSLIAATGVVAGATHVLTEDAHFDLVASLLKRVNLKRIRKMLRI
jgi:predicted nucleic acid-binding protein